MANRMATVALAVVGTCAVSGVAAAQPATIEMAVDGSAAGGELERVWPYYGFDEVNYTTTPEGRDLLTALTSAHAEAVHVRSHFLLNTDAGPVGLKWGSTNAYTEDAQGNPIYDWTTMDLIMDTVTGSGAYPFVEIAFMPQALSTRPNPYRNSSVTALDGGLFYPPADYQKWGELIREWATHTRDRYPDAESTWMWELWNEPDIAYWKGTQAEYNRLYDFTEAALHDVFPDASLAGPAVAGAGQFLTQFLNHCSQGTNGVSGATGTRLDMVTFHAKGGVAIVNGNVRMNMGNQMRLHRNGFNIVAGFPQFRQTPIVIGEADPDGCAACSTADVPADAYRNSTAYGAYEVVMMKRSLELKERFQVNLQGLLTWAFTFVPEPYFAGFRELSNNGIHKPVLNAFKLLGQLRGSRIPLVSSGARNLDDILQNSVRGQPDVDGMATRTESGGVQVLVWNYHDDIVTVPDTPVHLVVRVPESFGSQATLSHLRVDEEHGDAYTVWVAQGSPQNPSAAQIAAMRDAMEPELLEPISTLDVPDDGVVSLDLTLPRFGLSLLTLEPVPAPEQPDDEVDDAEPGPGAEPGDADGEETPTLGPVSDPADDSTGAATDDSTGDPGDDVEVAVAPDAPETSAEEDAPTGELPETTVAPLQPATSADEGCACRTGVPARRGPRAPGALAALALLFAAAVRRRSQGRSSS